MYEKAQSTKRKKGLRNIELKNIGHSIGSLMYAHKIGLPVGKFRPFFLLIPYSLPSLSHSILYRTWRDLIFLFLAHDTISKCEYIDYYIIVAFHIFLDSQHWNVK